MNFGIIILNQSIKTMQNYATCIQIVLLFILKLKIFMKEIANYLENISGTSNYEANRPLPTGKNKKAIGLMKR